MISLLLTLALQESAKPAARVEVRADGSVRVGGTAADWKDLGARLKGLKEATLQVDPEVPFSTVTRVMDLCKRAGVQTVEFAAIKTEPPPKLTGGAPSLRIKIRDGARGPEVILLREAPVSSIEELVRKLQGVEQQPVVIDAEYETSYALVKEVAEACTRAGFRSISFAAPAQRTGALRVLYVEHRPRWEYRFLKNALVRDADVRAHVLLTSVMEPQEHSEGLEPLTGFPQKLDYDVVILGDVPASRVPLDRIEAYVRDGGGLILIAGADSNPPADAALKALLPVTVGRAVSGEMRPRLTEAGRAHPITKDLNVGAEDFPSLISVLEVKPVEGATVLADVGDDLPLFVVKDHGKGRVFFSATEDTYRWRWLRGDNPLFYPLWQRAMRWVAQR
jgi:biopolymer transport protein ExbD